MLCRKEAENQYILCNHQYNYVVNSFIWQGMTYSGNSLVRWTLCVFCMYCFFIRSITLPLYIIIVHGIPLSIHLYYTHVYSSITCQRLASILSQYYHNVVYIYIYIHVYIISPYSNIFL